MGSSFVMAGFAEHASIVLGGTSALRASSALVYQACGYGHDGDIATLVFSKRLCKYMTGKHLHDTAQQDKETRHPGAG